MSCSFVQRLLAIASRSVLRRSRQHYSPQYLFSAFCRRQICGVVFALAYRQHQHNKFVVLNHANQTATLLEQLDLVTTRQFAVQEGAGEKGFCRRFASSGFSTCRASDKRDATSPEQPKAYRGALSLVKRPPPCLAARRYPCPPSVCGLRLPVSWIFPRLDVAAQSPRLRAYLTCG